MMNSFKERKIFILWLTFVAIIVYSTLNNFNDSISYSFSQKTARQIAQEEKERGKNVILKN